MGALKDAFEEHNKKIEMLSSRIVALELELTIVNKKYEDLCGKLRKNANKDRNYDLTNYGAEGKKGPWN
jgi:predicted  nucleic acid-binding Zn-ribbon protein